MIFLEGKSRLFDSGDISRVIKRIAHEISERNGSLEDIVIMGIKTRGIPFAHRLSDCIYEKIDSSFHIPVGELNISDFRDDVDKKNVSAKNAGIFPVDITDKIVILADDVIFTGRTVRAALDAVMSFGRPSKIQLAVLVDRGHRELPIRADYIGKNVPTSHREIVKVAFSETDGEDYIDLIRGV